MNQWSREIQEAFPGKDFFLGLRLNHISRKKPKGRRGMGVES